MITASVKFASITVFGSWVPRTQRLTIKVTGEHGAQLASCVRFWNPVLEVILPRGLPPQLEPTAGDLQNSLRMAAARSTAWEGPASARFVVHALAPNSVRVVGRRQWTSEASELAFTALAEGAVRVEVEDTLCDFALDVGQGPLTLIGAA